METVLLPPNQKPIATAPETPLILLAEHRNPDVLVRGRDRRPPAVERAARGGIVLDFDADGLLLGLEIIGATALLRERHCPGSRADLTTRLGRATGPRSLVHRHGSGRRGPALRP
jgi:hypothetical protein